MELYDSQGLPPSVVSDFSEEQGHSIEVPDGFLAMVADRHQGETKNKKKSETNIACEPTKLAFYDDMENKAQEGSFSEGVKEGQWTAWFEDGRITEGYYADGKKNEVWTSWWDYERTRKEMQGSYKNGKMVDKWFFYDKNGNLKEIRYFSPDF